MSKKSKRTCYELWIQLKDFSRVECIPFHKSWNIFYNFSQWYESAKIPGGCIDFKMMSRLGEVSPSSCFFAPKRLMMLFVGKPNNRDLPPGIYPNVGGREECPYRVISYQDGKRKQIGVYKSVEEAQKVYAITRLDYSLSVVEEYAEILNERVLNLYRKACYDYCLK